MQSLTKSSLFRHSCSMIVSTDAALCIRSFAYQNRVVKVAIWARGLRS